MSFEYIDKPDEVYDDKCWFIDIDGNTLNYDLEEEYIANIGVEYINGSKGWFLNGMRHRLNGPAVIYDNNDKAWYQYNQVHRENGPAIEYMNQPDMNEYWFCDVLYTLNDYLKLLKLEKLP